MLRTFGPGFGFAVNTYFERSPDGDQIRAVVGLGREAEQAGFDSIWVGDHIMWHTPILDPVPVLAALAATTDRVWLGGAVMLLGLRPRVAGAKSVLSLNALSAGRFVLGVGVGGEYPAEFDECGVPLSRRGAALDRNLGFLMSHWDPNHQTVGDICLEPAGPLPPLLVGGRSDAARRRIQRFGAGWLAAFVSADRIRQEKQLLGADVPVALHVYVRTGADVGATRREAADFLSRLYGMDGDRLMRYTIAGPPEFCAEKLTEYAQAGVEHFVLRPAGWDAHAQLENWGSELLPRLKAITHQVTS
jgi:alkanesulfonate monooxygenase SsuD/methylene tetrahydromethanopterin reductase-like flavin-dependent oxidoreductase (luciferase family)